MAVIIPMTHEDFDYEHAVWEVDIIITRYIDSLQILEETMTVADIPLLLTNTIQYSERLEALMRRLEPYEEDIDFNVAMRDTLQRELSTLEIVYMFLNRHLAQGGCCDAVATIVLTRMDVILEKMGFPDDHADRQFVREILEPIATLRLKAE